MIFVPPSGAAAILICIAPTGDVVTDWAERVGARLVPANVLRARARPDRTKWEALMRGGEQAETESRLPGKLPSIGGEGKGEILARIGAFYH